MSQATLVLLILADKPLNDVVWLQFVLILEHVIGINLVQVSELVVYLGH